MADEKPIRLRPRKPKSQQQDESKSWSKAFKGLIRVVRMTTRHSSPRAKKAAGTARANRTSSRNQRCAVRLTYSPNRIKGQWSAHGRYLMRDGAVEPDLHDDAAGFDAAKRDIDISPTLRDWQAAGDPRLFKLIISPEFGERLELTKLVRNLMQRVEADLGYKLEWVAVNHFNTSHPHAHVVLRGVSEGQQVRLEREYVKHSIRRHAEELCTQDLGFRTQADAIEAERREIDRPRLTSLDRQIARSQQTQSGHAFQIEVESKKSPNVLRRLAVLQTMGMAERTGTRTWAVRSDFEAVLRTMQTVTDRQRMVASHAHVLSDVRLPIQHTPVATISELEGRVIGHVLDEGSGKVQMILESIQGRVHLIPHDESLERERAGGSLAPGRFVRVTKSGRHTRTLVVVDHGDAETYLDSVPGRRYCVGAENLDHGTDYGGWLGRYWKARGKSEVKTAAKSTQIGGRSPR